MHILKHLVMLFATSFALVCGAETNESEPVIRFLDTYDQLNDHKGQNGHWFVRDAGNTSTGQHGDPTVIKGWAMYIWDARNPTGPCWRKVSSQEALGDTRGAMYDVFVTKETFENKSGEFEEALDYLNAALNSSVTNLGNQINVKSQQAALAAIEEAGRLDAIIKQDIADFTKREIENTKTGIDKQFETYDKKLSDVKIGLDSQIRSGDTKTLKEAKAYTDSVITNHITGVDKKYVDDATNAVVQSVDGQLNSVRTDLRSGMTSLTNYVDECVETTMVIMANSDAITLTNAMEYANSLITNIHTDVTKEYVDIVVGAAANAARTYTDQSTVAVKQEAEEYTDQEIEKLDDVYDEKGSADIARGSAIDAANAYTDGEIAKIPTHEKTRVVLSNLSKSGSVIATITVDGVPYDIRASTTATAFTVKFMDGDTELKVEPVLKYGNATPPIPPTKEGYDFVGWSDVFTNVTWDTVTTAQYERNYCTVSFIDGNKLYTNVYVNIGNKIGMVPDAPKPKKNNQIFYNWTYGNESILNVDTIIESNMVVNAKYIFDWADERKWMKNLKVGDELTAPSAYGFDEIVFEVVDKGNVYVSGNTNTITLQTKCCLSKNESKEAIVINFSERPSRNWNASSIKTWLNNEELPDAIRGNFLGSFLLDNNGDLKIGSELAQAQSFIGSISNPTLRTYTSLTDYTDKSNCKVWLPSFKQIGGGDPPKRGFGSENECLSKYLGIEGMGPNKKRTMSSTSFQYVSCWTRSACSEMSDSVWLWGGLEGSIGWNVSKSDEDYVSPCITFLIKDN